MVQEPFSPFKHGFHFRNHFATELIDIGSLNWTTHGICGGMAFSAMDYYLAGMAVPSHVEDQINPNTQNAIVIHPNDIKSRLIQYLYDRLLDSLKANWETFVSWTEKDNNDASQSTKGDEFKKLEAKIQQFGAWPIGLVRVDSIWDIGKNHQVVAYQCWTDPNGDMVVSLYDNNFQDQVTTLTSKKGDIGFTSDLDNRHIRGFFVEDYDPHTPTYFDLVFTQGLSISRKKPLRGDPVEASYNLRNDGEFPTTLTPCVAVDGSAGRDLSALILNEVTLNPGEQQECSFMNPTFGGRWGTYTLTAGYLRNPGSIQTFINALPGAGPRTATLEIDYPNEPPYVIDVMALKAPLGQTPIGFGGFDISNLTECQKAKPIYSAVWGKREPDGTRRLNVITNEATSPTKALYIFMRFGWDSWGSAAPMKADTVKLTMKRLDANNQVIDAIAPVLTPGLAPSGDVVYYWACVSWSSFMGAPWRASDRLYLEIDGTDVLDHYPGRTPIGNVIDSKPETVAVPDTNTDPLKQWTGYDPGTDQEHSISVIPKSPFKTTDTQESNDSFATASLLTLGMPGPTGSVQELKDLSIGTSNDVDYYKLQYQCPQDDDNWTGPAKPQTSKSQHGGPIGLITTFYPPSLQIDVTPKDDCCVSLELCHSDRSIYADYPSSNSVVVYAPTREFKDHSLYVVVKNADYATQGGFAYDLKLTYRSPYAESVITRVPLGYDYPIFIRRYCDAMGIPEPSLEAIREAIAAGRPYVMTSPASIDATTQFRRYAAFLNNSGTQEIIRATEGDNADKTIAGMLYDAAKLAETLALSDDAENLYKSSAVAAGKDTDTKSLVLRDLASLYERTGRNSQAKELLIRIRGQRG